MLMIDNITTYCHNSKLQFFSITLLQNISGLTSMKVISFYALVCVDKGYTNVSYMEHKN